LGHSDKVTIRTEVLTGFKPNKESLALLNLCMANASMAGAVHDEAKGTVDLSSTVRLHSGIADWMNRFLRTGF
jgi:hypothetical protein